MVSSAKSVLFELKIVGRTILAKRGRFPEPEIFFLYVGGGPLILDVMLPLFTSHDSCCLRVEARTKSSSGT